MAKKLSLLLASIAVVAFAVPAFASAAQLTEGGSPVEAGELILGTSTNATTKTSAGTLACANVTVTGEVTKNEGGVVEGVGKGAGTGTTCTVGGKNATVSDITLQSIKAVGPSSPENNINVTFNAVIAGVNCHFESPTVAFTYTSGTDSLNISEGDLVGKPAATCEPGLLSGDFALETDSAEIVPVILD